MTNLDKTMGRLYTLDKFIENCENGLLTDYDGFGQYAIGENIFPPVAYPSDIMSGIIYDEYSHVIWFNK